MPSEFFFFTSMTSSISVSTPIILGMLFFPYIVLKFRERRDELRDPQLGMKAVLHYFVTVGVLVAVTGLSIVVADKLRQAFGGSTRYGARDSEFLTMATRVGLALLFSGVIVTAVSVWIIATRTNESRWLAVRRAYTGVRLAISGIVTVFSLTGLMITLFMGKEMGGDSSQAISVFLGLLFVWSSAAVADFSILAYGCKCPIAPDRGHECFFCSHDVRDAVAAAQRKCSVCGSLIPNRQYFRYRKPTDMESVQGIPAPIVHATSAETDPLAPEDDTPEG